MPEIRVQVKDFGFEGVIKGYGGDDLVLVEFPGGIRDWFPVSHLVVLIDQEEIEEYIKHYDDVLFVAEPQKGFPSMSRQVRLVVGEGENKIQVGTAEVQPTPNGETMVMINVTHEGIAKLLGGNEIKGVIPRVVAEQPEMSGEGQGE